MYLMSVHLISMHLMGVYLIDVHVMGMHHISMHLMGVYIMGVYLKGGYPNATFGGRWCCISHFGAKWQLGTFVSLLAPVAAIIGAKVYGTAMEAMKVIMRSSMARRGQGRSWCQC
jgi:hypothetical protein